MPSVSGLGLTFTLPNYTSEVLTVTPSDTPFLSAIGGLNEQGEVVASTEFEGQTQDLGTPSQPSIVEGADAPTLSERSRSNWSNVAQIFQYAYGVSYTRQAAVQQLAGLANGRMNPITDEMANQDTIKLTEASRDINYSFINGVYQKPSDNNTGRKTRGILAACTTTALDNRETAIAITAATTDIVSATAHGLSSGDQVIISSLTGGTGLTVGSVYFVLKIDADTFKLSTSRGGAPVDITVLASAGTIQRLTQLTAARTLDLVQSVWDNFGVNTTAEPTLMVGAALKRSLTKLFISDKGYQEVTRNVGGVTLTTLETDFGRINLMLERAMPRYTLSFVHLGLCKPAYLLIPGKGFLFAEDLAKTGAQSKRQLYGEVGLWHGPQQAHGKIEYVGEVAGA